MDRESKFLAINYFLSSQLPSFIFFLYQRTVFHFNYATGYTYE